MYNNLRKFEPEPITHTDFIMKSVMFDEAEFCLRTCRPKLFTGDEHKEEYYSTRKHLRSHYGFKPLVEGVQEVFERIDWSKYWQGAGRPAVSSAQIIQAYTDYKGGSNV